MTEIPEHLLKRAAARRAAATGGEAAADAPAGDAPAAGGDAPAAAVTPAKKAPAPLPTLDDEPAQQRPELAVVAASKRRKRVPFWAAPVLAFLPVWAFVYVYAVQPPPAGASDPIAIGKEIYVGNCQGCHGANGEGGAGQALKDGATIDTFADPLDMTHWISFGAGEGARADGSYGDADRPGGARNTSDLPGVMPAFKDSLSAEELAAVVIYIRQELAGGDPADDPNFNAATFEADPEAAAATTQQVIDLGPGGEPDTASVEGAETE